MNDKNMESPPSYNETQNSTHVENMHVQMPQPTFYSPDMTTGAQQQQQPLIYQPPQQITAIYAPIVMHFGSHPQNINCMNCQAHIMTRVSHRNGLLTWLICGGLCFFGLGLGCCLIPFCIDDLKDVEHYCPNCNALLGTYRRI